jgi:predicted secreted Zn-dependent protease
MAAVTIGLTILLVASIYLHWSAQEGAVPDDEATASSGSTGAAAAIPAFAGLPNVAVAYYDIDATDPAGIRAQLDERGPRFKGKQFAAITNWYYRWSWDDGAFGRCGTANAKVTLESNVLLPRLVHIDSVDPAVARAWHSFFDALTRHEAGHVRLASEGRAVVADAVRSSSCGDANAAGRSAIQALDKTQAEYDLRTRHGRRDGAFLAI